MNIRNLSLTVLAGVAVIFALQQGRDFFIPLVLSVLISYALDPIVSNRRQRGFELSAADYVDTQRRFASARTGLQRRLVDVDALIVARAGKSIAEMFTEDGEDAFRAPPLARFGGDAAAAPGASCVVRRPGA